MANDNWTFFRAFLKAPKVVAAALPSSNFLVRRVIKAADAKNADVIVELGAGTGGTTRALLEAMQPDAKLLAIEYTEEFGETLRRIDDPRLELVFGCASTIVEQLESRGLGKADAVVSGIPFSTMPEALGAEIAQAVGDALAPGGRFVAYQFSDRVAVRTTPVMGSPKVEHELRNVPPMRVFSWQKAAAPDAAASGEQVAISA